MPVTNYPGSDIARNIFLTTAMNTHSSDEADGNVALMPATVSSLGTISTRFNALVINRDNSSGERQTDVREKNEALHELRTYCLHGLTSVKNRVARMNEPVEILTNYGITASGNNPRLSLSADLTVQADQIIVGDAKTVEQGYPAMVNPTAAEISAVNEKARKELADIASADRKVDQAEEELAAVREEVDLLIRDIVSDLNYNLRHVEDASRRRIMRSYGVKFKSDCAE